MNERKTCSQDDFTFLGDSKGMHSTKQFNMTAVISSTCVFIALLKTQEVITLTISTVWWEEENLKLINVVGMVVCVSGIALHVFIKATTVRGEREQLKKLIR